MTSDNTSPSNGHESSGNATNQPLDSHVPRRAVLAGVSGLAALSSTPSTSQASAGDSTRSDAAESEGDSGPSELYSATTEQVFVGHDVETYDEEATITVDGYPDDHMVALQLAGVFGTTSFTIPAGRARDVAHDLLDAADHAEGRGSQ